MLLIVSLLARLLTRLPTLMVENPLHRLPVISAVGGDGRLGRWGTGRLTVGLLTPVGWPGLPTRLAIPGLTILASLIPSTRPLPAVLRRLFTVSWLLLATLGLLRGIAFGRRVPWLLVAAGLAGLVTTATIAGLLAGITIPLGPTVWLFAITLCLAGLATFSGLARLRRSLASSRLPRLLLLALRPLPALPLLRARRATGVLHA